MASSVNARSLKSSSWSSVARSSSGRAGGVATWEARGEYSLLALPGDRVVIHNAANSGWIDAYERTYGKASVIGDKRDGSVASWSPGKFPDATAFHRAANGNHRILDTKIGDPHIDSTNEGDKPRGAQVAMANVAERFEAQVYGRVAVERPVGTNKHFNHRNFTAARRPA